MVDELVRSGVTDAVLCPGSRNAPLSFALQAADAAGRLRLHVRIDERTAGFLAVGLALRSGRPVPVTCTSGTAAANLHPAVLEASHAGVPLLALTADRPPAMIGTGANQTIIQSGLYGEAPRLAVTVELASGSGETAWRSVVHQAVAAATGADGGRPGPVHLNLPFAEPLVPDAALASERAAPHLGRPRGVAATPGEPLPLDPQAPTLVVAGSGTTRALGAEPAGVPVIAEPTSPLWPAALRAGPWLLDRPELRPRQVVVIGRPTLHRSVNRLLDDDAVAVYAVPTADAAPWTGAHGTVRAVGALPTLCSPSAFAARWHAADGAAGTALDSQLDGALDNAPVGLRLARDLVAALPAGALLVLGSSNPVRDVSLAAAPRAGLTVLSNRGVSGIDGTVSTAVGAALSHGEPAYALLGDLTLLHDSTGLVIGPDEPRPQLTIVVLNDDGGGVFSLLEQGAPEHARAFERVFGTAHGVDFAALAAAVGMPHRRLEELDVLAKAVQPEPGMRLVEVPAERGALRAGHAAIRAAINEAVDDLT